MAVQKNILVRGTTPTDTFDFLMALDEVEKVIIVYKQMNHTLEKEFTEFRAGQTSIEYTLTQEESLQFHVGELKISCIIKFLNGNRIESQVIKKEVQETAKRSIL